MIFPLATMAAFLQKLFFGPDLKDLDTIVELENAAREAEMAALTMEEEVLKTEEAVLGEEEKGRFRTSNVA